MTVKSKEQFYEYYKKGYLDSDLDSGDNDISDILDVSDDHDQFIKGLIESEFFDAVNWDIDCTCRSCHISLHVIPHESMVCL